jgi:hypothetical protein
MIRGDKSPIAGLTTKSGHEPYKCDKNKWVHITALIEMSYATKPFPKRRKCIAFSGEKADEARLGTAFSFNEEARRSHARRKVTSSKHKQFKLV